MLNILFVHQSAELYGSDKTLLLLLKHLDRTLFHPVVILPSPGPLQKELESIGITVVIAPVLKLYRKMFSPKNLWNFFKEVKTGIAMLDLLHRKYQFSLIYSNTLAVLMGIIYARKRHIKHIWHVHEIIESPKIFSKLFSMLLGIRANTAIVYNSKATAMFWNSNDAIKSKSEVIWNGIETNTTQLSEARREAIRAELFGVLNDDIVIALIGRISRWKGQLVLLNAFRILDKKYSGIRLFFVGSAPPGQVIFEDNLRKEISRNSLQEKVSIIPFQTDISAVWRSIDIAVVPSTDPEPFGLVAIEAMLAAKPVIGTNHGGITEIVLHNETGLLIEPGNEHALANAIQQLLDDSHKRIAFGKSGLQRVQLEFSIEKHVNSFEKLFCKL